MAEVTQNIFTSRLRISAIVIGILLCISAFLVTIRQCQGKLGLLSFNVFDFVGCFPNNLIAVI